MKRVLYRLCATGVAALCLAFSHPALAADLPSLEPAQGTAAAALQKDAVCTKCHDESESKPILSLYQTRHGVRGDARTPSCQGCHGSSPQHVAGGKGVGEASRPSPDVVFKRGASPASDDATRVAQCLGCHSNAKRSNWDGGKHQTAGLACNDCHQVHVKADRVLAKVTQPTVCYACHKEQRADGKKISHHPIEEGKVVCSDCHNPHGSTGPKLLARNTVTETCYQCHAEKRGPFLFEHRPAVEDCANCHSPHGSNISPLLKTRPPFMCQECHDGTHASGTAVGPNAGGFQAGLARSNANGVAQFPNRNVVGRACTNCHSQIHGSNSPAGGYLQR